MKKKLTTTQYARAFYELTKDLKGEKTRAAVTEFVKLLARHHKLKQGTRIIADFECYAKKQEGVVPLEIVSARDMADKELKKIAEVFSDNAEVTPATDASLLGGVIVKTDERIFDGSLKTQLQKLKQNLIK